MDDFKEFTDRVYAAIIEYRGRTQNDRYPSRLVVHPRRRMDMLLDRRWFDLTGDVRMFGIPVDCSIEVQEDAFELKG